MILILTYDLKFDEAARCLDGITIDGHKKVHTLTLNNLLNSCEFSFYKEGSETYVKGTLPNGLEFDGKKDILLNRALSFEKLSIDNRPIKEPTRKEFQLFLISFLKGFKKKTSLPGLYSLCGDKLPLNLQWHHLKNQAGLDLSYPDFEYSFGYDTPQIEGLKKPVFTQPDNYYYWKSEKNDKPRWNSFIIDKPEGLPIVSYFSGSCISVQAFDESQKIEESIINKIKEYTSVIKKQFNYFMGEMVFFLENENLKFGFISPLFKISAQYQGLPSTLKTGLLDYVRGHELEKEEKIK